MNNKRRHTLCILILIMTSLFLSSCGEPSLCTLSGLSLKGTYSDDDIIISIGDSDTDLVKLSSGPGLLLCYCIGDVNLEAEVDDAYTPFANMVKNKLVISDNNSILTFGSGTVLYALHNNNGTRITSPSYCYNYFNDISGTSLKKSLTLSYENNNLLKLDGVSFKTNDLTPETEDQYIYILGAFSAELGSFSNNYWSALKYLGRFKISLTD